MTQEKLCSVNLEWKQLVGILTLKERDLSFEKRGMCRNWEVKKSVDRGSERESVRVWKSKEYFGLVVKGWERERNELLKGERKELYSGGFNCVDVTTSKEKKKTLRNLIQAKRNLINWVVSYLGCLGFCTTNFINLLSTPILYYNLYVCIASYLQFAHAEKHWKQKK